MTTISKVAGVVLGCSVCSVGLSANYYYNTMCAEARMNILEIKLLPEYFLPKGKAFSQEDYERLKIYLNEPFYVRILIPPPKEHGSKWQ